MSEYNAWLHRYAVLVVLCTLILVYLGGLVTSTESGLAVPDWPLSYGMVFPPMVGGVLYEHGHRLAAATVGFLTILLAGWLWRREARAGVRRLGALALVSVIFQGLLGGLTVLFLLPTAISVAHAGTAQIFFCLVVSVAAVTSRRWRFEKPRIEEPPGVSVRTLSAATTAIIYMQIILGAIMRHTKSGLAIPDFPLSFGRLVPPEFTGQILANFAHRVGAVVAGIFIVWLAVTVLRRHGAEPWLARPAAVLVCAVILQISLAAWTVWSAKAVIPTTLHVAGGSFTLGACLVLALRIHRLVGRRDALEAVVPVRAGAAAE